jgi:prefoldin subunit 5
VEGGEGLEKLKRRVSDIEDQLESIKGLKGEILEGEETVRPAEAGKEIEEGEELEPTKEVDVIPLEPSETEEMDLKEAGERIKDTNKQLGSALKDLKGRIEGVKKGEIKTKEEIPGYMEDWIKRNLDLGFSPEQLKVSLRKSGNDPGLVDIYLKSENN